MNGAVTHHIGRQSILCWQLRLDYNQGPAIIEEGLIVNALHANKNSSPLVSVIEIRRQEQTNDSIFTWLWYLSML